MPAGVGQGIGAIIRIRVVANGAYAIFGSDAVVGVVNLIPARNLDGIAAFSRYSAANGGDWVRFGVHWLDWQLKGGEAAASMFVGDECGLCSDENWTIERKNFQQDQ